MSSLQIQVVLTTLLLVITAAKLTEGTGTYQCGHQHTPVHQLRYAAVANTASGPHREKRQTGSEFRPIRMLPFYDSTVQALPQDQQMSIKNDAIKPVIDFFERTISVRPLVSKILFQRDCNGNSTPFLNPRGFCPRSEGCANSSKCAGFTTFPEDHLACEGRKFFGCDSLPGIPIEDIARPGTGGTHFEQRVFNNEAMTGSVGASNSPFSRFTLALYEDSGWYKPNYDVADPLRWGMNQGCDFVLEGCLKENYSLRPLFCDNFHDLPYFATASHFGKASFFREIGGNSSCFYDRGSLGTCNDFNQTTPFDPNFQYFRDPELGGTDILADQCPFVDGYISCKRPRAAYLTVNAFAETHGPNSRCVDFRIDGNWIIQNRTVGPIHGGACYEVYCDEVQGPIVSVMGTNYTCTSGKEIYIPQVDLPNLANVITIVCPPCEDLCWDNLDACSAVVTPTVVVPTTTSTGPTTTTEPTAPTTTTEPTAPTVFGASIPSVALFGGALLLFLIAVVVAVVVTVVLCVVRRKHKKARRVQYAKLLDVNDEEEDDDMLGADSDY